ncbi:amino acid transporter [Terriglobus roseus DSM 18391]|uniref:Amino acid transporter n=1 Tax=Terriglobus roseus (strain DSM 18391 / NRRL B-41598 / KBS 63) TaxID=926566 RepID=I3ZF95_TERRK|nr:APC family permease [Terriglobus roseus]AFL87913.1 amino acid transporter [Terriglobus roseus DSM 18391]
MASKRIPAPTQSSRVRLVVASSVMLTFISFWRAAAIVLNDLGSSAFYAGGIAEEAVGKSAPWLILGVMLFSYAVRAVYVESCSMYTRGGVYRIVKEALGGTFAKISVSALMFDYVLTGPISGVSAGQYIVGLFNGLFIEMSTSPRFHALVTNAAGSTRQLNVNHTSAGIAIIITLYFWWQNIKGIEESSEKALTIMKITTIMVIILIGWGLYSVGHYGAHLPPLPTPSNLKFSDASLGFLKHTSFARSLGLFGILMAFGHSVLAMSGEESLAQVNREIEHPKLQNLKRAALIIAIYSMVFTGLGSLLAVMLIPDGVRVSVYRDNMIAGMAMYMVGPLAMRVAFRVFVVIVGFLILGGAVNTAIVGSTGVLMRVAEDGVLADWFRKPQRKFGTSYRIVNLVCIIQLFVIIVTRGDVIMIGEAYAFGVIWSFTFNALAMLVLRWKYKGERGAKVPLNLKIGKTEYPIGLACVFLVLLTIAIVNLFTKSVATVSGIIFAVAFFIIFSLSERDNRRRHKATERQMKEHFQLEHSEEVGRDDLAIRSGGVLVTMRDAQTPHALKWALARTDTDDQDVVVLAARMMGAGGPEYVDASEQLFSEHEQMLFTKAVSVAESFGKHIGLVVVPAGDVFAAIVRTANSLDVAAVVSGLSTKLTAQEQAYHVGQAWETLPEPKRQFTFYVVPPIGEAESFHIGPHTPSIPASDVQLVHRLWLNMRRDPDMEHLHHSDIVTFALTRLASSYANDRTVTSQQLRMNMDEQSQRRGLGAVSRFEDTDDEGPGYSLKTAGTNANNADA